LTKPVNCGIFMAYVRAGGSPSSQEYFRRDDRAERDMKEEIENV